MDILDSEASEDEAARNGGAIERPPSHEANQGLVTKYQKYRDILDKAAGSDELVRRKWDQWEMNIKELTWDEVSPIKATRVNTTDLVRTPGSFNRVCSIIHRLGS
jgi:hypothetical protein